MWANVHVGAQVGREVPSLVSGDADQAVFDLPVEVVGPVEAPDFRGKAVHGPRGARFLYLSWGEVDDEGRFAMFRRAKLLLTTVPTEELRSAVDTGVLEASLPLTDRKGDPLCASVRPPVLVWRAAH
jgi:hypothetical protein